MKARFVDFKALAVCGAFGLLIGGCAGEGEPSTSEGERFEIAIAPLEYLAASDACYTLTVYEGDPATADVVWSESDVCASQFGFGAAISYVGPCVADVDNTVELVIQDIYEAPNVGPDPANALPASEWQNPCPTSAPCTQVALCQENADVPITFNLTVMRDANQGFFDIAVNFEDIFCSAKFDCAYCDDNTPPTCDPINLLHDDDGNRNTTVILAVACSAGASDEVDSYMHMEFVTISCDDGAGNVTYYPINPMGVSDPPTPGNQGAIPDFIYQHQISWGPESLPGIDKDFWTIAIGLDTVQMATHGTCTLSAAATASDGQWGGGFSPDNSVYPVLQFEVPLNEGGSDALTCTENPLNGEGSGVFTGYTSLDQPYLFSFYQHDGVLDGHCWCDQANGYEFNPEEDGCVRVTSEAATVETQTWFACDGDAVTSYGLRGARFFTTFTPGTLEGGTNADCDATPDCSWSDADVWKVAGLAQGGYLSDIGIWACSDSDLDSEVDPFTGIPLNGNPPLNQWIGFSHCLDIAESGQYMIGMAGDNHVRFQVNGQTIWQSSQALNFYTWNIFPVQLSSGLNVITLLGQNDGAAAGFAAEIYGPFPSGSLQTAADMNATLNDDPASSLLFSTRDFRPTQDPVSGEWEILPFTTSQNGGSGALSGMTCPPDYALNTCGEPSVCSLIEHDVCQDPVFDPNSLGSGGLMTGGSIACSWTQNTSPDTWDFCPESAPYCDIVVLSSKQGQSGDGICVASPGDCTIPGDADTCWCYTDDSFTGCAP